MVRTVDGDWGLMIMYALLTYIKAIMFDGLVFCDCDLFFLRSDSSPNVSQCVVLLR